MCRSDGTVISTTTVSEPGDLTGIGIKMNKALSAWEDDDARTHVCFDSLTTLLQYVDTRRAFQYLHVTTKRVESAGAIAHYHIDPEAHDEQTLATIESLFSDVFEYGTETGTWSRI
jgi:2C-methyl-D-erythritol 2,4-cyclodiphosphate synthase